MFLTAVSCSFASEFHTDDPAEPVVRGQQEDAALAGPEINKGELFVAQWQSGHDRIESGGVGRNVLPTIDPVVTADGEVAQVGSVVEIAVGVGAVRGIEVATRQAHQLAAHLDFLHKVDGQKETALQ